MSSYFPELSIENSDDGKDESSFIRPKQQLEDQRKEKLTADITDVSFNDYMLFPRVRDILW